MAEPGRWRQVVLALVALVALAPGIARLPPTDRDESRFVQATKQMLERGDFVDIRFQDEPRYKKPAGIYWLQAAAAGLSGKGADAPVAVYRAVSVVAGVVAVLLTAAIGARLFGPAAGMLAGLMLAALFGLQVEARIAKTDAALLAAALLAQFGLVHLYLGASDGMAARRRDWLALWGGIGAGILLKGPVVPLLIGLTVAGLAVAGSDRAWLRRLRPGPGLLVATAIAAPWLIAITMVAGTAFWTESVGRDLLGKVAAGQESHGFPPGYYFLTFALFVWPFGHLAVEGGLKALARWREKQLAFLLAWYLPYWLVMELVPTKLPHYMLPAYPAAVIAAAFALTATAATAPRWHVWFGRLALFGQGLVTIALAAIVAAAAPMVTGSLSLAGIAAALLVLAAGALGTPLAGAWPALRRVAVATAAAAAAMALAVAVVAPALTPLWLSPQIATAFSTLRPCPHSRLAAVDYHEPSLVFLTATDTLLTDIDGAAALLAEDPACAVALVPEADVATLAAGGELRTLSTFTGFNYSKGDARRLALVTRGP